MLEMTTLLYCFDWLGTSNCLLYEPHPLSAIALNKGLCNIIATILKLYGGLSTEDRVVRLSDVGVGRGEAERDSQCVCV